MAIYIKIKKYQKINQDHYYFVSTEDFGGGKFYIGVNSTTKIVKLFKDHECKILICSFDFKNPDEKIGYVTSEINERLIPYAIMKIYKALQKNEFPEDISYCA